MKENTLLSIVRKWKINKNPEYRAFRCANCQKYIRKAFHYWLKNSNYSTPVHFCKRCQRKLAPEDENKKEYKSFKCEKCRKNVYKAYHIWVKIKGILSEIHFCRKCWTSTKKNLKK